MVKLKFKGGIFTTVKKKKKIEYIIRAFAYTGMFSGIYWPGMLYFIHVVSYSFYIPSLFAHFINL